MKTPVENRLSVVLTQHQRIDLPERYLVVVLGRCTRHRPAETIGEFSWLRDKRA